MASYDLSHFDTGLNKQVTEVRQVTYPLQHKGPRDPTG